MSKRLLILCCVGVALVAAVALLLAEPVFSVRSKTWDTVKTLVVALGPGAMSLVVTVVASQVARTRAVHRVLGVVALGFILIQVGVVYVACRVFEGGLLLNSFTITGLVGLIVYVAALVKVLRARSQAISRARREGPGLVDAPNERR